MELKIATQSKVSQNGGGGVGRGFQGFRSKQAPGGIRGIEMLVGFMQGDQWG